MTDFGDFDLADAYDEDPTIASEQVTYRLHEMRVALEILAGRDADDWDLLLPVERELALGIGEAVVGWIYLRVDNDPEDLAMYLHNVRVFFGPPSFPSWEELSAEERHVAVAMMEGLVDWLETEGPR